MEILFDSAFNGRTWPLWPDKRKGRLGSIRVGQLGLLGLLETMLGLRGPVVPEGVRIASLIPLVRGNKKAFWAQSAEVDPFGVAREILSLHDFLVMYGWQGQPLTPRLSDLSSLSNKMLPGLPQRFRGVLSGLDDFTGTLPAITMLQDVDTLPLLFQEIFKKLQDMDASCISEKVSAAQDADHDLGSARKDKFSPSVDGSLQLIRPDGVLQAAEEVAAWLAQVAREEGLNDTVIIGSDAVLDNALYQFGMPVTGEMAESSDSLTQLLPLVLSMGWNPPDPARIIELLTLPASPVPQSIGRKLIAALSKWPALGSELWHENLEEGLSAIKDKSRREQTAKRLSVLFTPAVEDDSYPVSEIKSRVGMLTRWLRGRFQDDPVSHAAHGQCRIFLTMVDAIGFDTLNEPLLKKLLDESFAAIAFPSPLPAQAGLASVSEPEAIVGPAKRIIWWNFNRNTVPPLTFPILSSAERNGLAGAGVLLPESSLPAAARAARWRRPLDCAEQQLILVCPLQDAAGEELHPHPLWDELLAISDDKANKLIAAKIRSAFSIPTRTPDQLSLPEPQTEWQVAAGAVKPREVESPSSLENFLGCPFKWCLNYNARIRGGHSATLPDMLPTLGSLAHELVEEVLLQKELPAPEEGASLAGKLFDEKAPQLVAPLFQEGMEAKQEEIRNTVMLATRSLLQHLHDAGVNKLAIEQHLTGSFGSQKLQGWADVVLETPFTVIDLKRSWANFYKKKMESGTALQIVIYGWLLKESHGTFPGLSYFTLEDQNLLTTDPVQFPNGDAVKARANDEVWKAFEKTFNEAWKVLKDGVVLCPGNGEDVESRLEDDLLILEPPCRFCDYDVLCGRRFS